MPNIPRSIRRPWQPEKVQFEKAVDNKFYHSTAWRKFRKIFLQNHPLCVMCHQQGIITEATTVDHITSINPINGWNTENGKYPNPLNADNCQALCFRCHASKSGKTKNKSDMKKILTILILTTLATIASGQSLMLSVQRSVIKAEMRRVEGFTLTDNLPDYLEYSRGDQTIAYEFEKTGHKWLCVTAAITMPEAEADTFIQDKLDCNCWKPVSADLWQYETNMFDSPVYVTRTNQGELVRFTYEF